MTRLQRYLHRTVQDGKLVVIAPDGERHEVRLRAAQDRRVAQLIDGSLVTEVRNWTQQDAVTFVRRCEVYVYFGWTRRVPILRHWAPRVPPSSARTDIAGLRVRQLRLEGRVEGVSIQKVWGVEVARPPVFA